MKRLFVLAIALAALPVSAQMLMRTTPPQHRLVHRNTVAIRVNPLGLIYEGRFSYRFRLHENDDPVMRDNFIGIGLTPGASPAFVRGGAFFEIQPISIIGFWATYEFMQYFGNFNLAQSFPSASSNFSDTEIRQRGELNPTDPQHSYAANGTVLTLGMNINLKFGPVIVRSQGRLVRPEFNLRVGDTTIYDQFYDLLLPNRGFALVNDLDVLYQTEVGLVAGLRYTFGIPFYTAAQAPVQDNSTHRIGPFIAYRFETSMGRRSTSRPWPWWSTGG